MGTLPVGSTQNKPVSLTNGKAVPGKTPQKTPRNDLHYSPPPYDVTMLPININEAAVLSQEVRPNTIPEKVKQGKTIKVDKVPVKEGGKVDEKGGVMVLVSDIVDYASSLYDDLGKLASELFNEVAGLVTTKERVVKDISTSETRLDKLEKSGQGKSAEAIQLKAKIEKLKSLNSQLDDLIVSANRIRETLKSGKLNKEEYINSLLNKAGIEKRTKEIQDEFAEIEGSLPLDRENAPLIFKAQVLVVKGEKQVVEIVNLSTELNITATKILEKNPYDKSTKDAAAGLIAQSWIDLQETNSSVKLTLDKAQVSLENLLPLVSGIEKEKVNTTIDTAKNLKSRQAEVEVVLTNGAREYLAVVKALQLDVDPALLRNVGAVAYGESVSREQGASGDEMDWATLEWADRSTEYLGRLVEIITNARIDERVREILFEAKNELKEMEKEAIKEEENKKEAAAKEGARKKGEKAHLLALKIDALLKRGEISVSGPEATKLRRLALEQLQDNKPA